MSRYYTSHMIKLLIISLASLKLVTADYACYNSCYDSYGACTSSGSCASASDCIYCSKDGYCRSYLACQDIGSSILTWVLTSIFISVGSVVAVLIIYMILRCRRNQKLRNLRLNQECIKQENEANEKATVPTVESSYVIGYLVGPPSNNNNTNSGQGFQQQNKQQQLGNYNYQQQQPQQLQYQCVIPANNQPGQKVSQQTQQIQIQQQQQQQLYAQTLRQQQQQYQPPKIYDAHVQ